MCAGIETSTTIVGSVAGFVAGGGGGALVAAGTGGLGLPAVPAGAAAGAAAGGAIGYAAGQAITNVLFSESSSGNSGGGGRNSDPAKGLREQLESHKKKLADYKANPDAFDNKGFLRNATPALREKIINSRIRNLEGQICDFQEQIRRIEGGQ